MKLARQYEFSAAQDRSLKKARFLAYVTIAYICSVIFLMYNVMGASQAMKSAFIEDILSLVPPICFLVGTHICWRPPTRHFPYGFHRVISILFLVAALSLMTMGTYLLIDAAVKLAVREHPTIGMKEYFGVDMWLGWWMLLVLLYATFPPIILGHMKIRHAEILNDKILITDGKMNKADWMTAVAAMVGVLGIGAGWWWLDGVAAAVISIDIMRDGWLQLKNSVGSLINCSPTSVHNKYLDLPDRLRHMLLQFPWIADAHVRLYEHGHVIFGEGFIETRDGRPIDPADLRKAMAAAREMDWRLLDFSLTVNSGTDQPG